MVTAGATHGTCSTNEMAVIILFITKVPTKKGTGKKNSAMRMKNGLIKQATRETSPGKNDGGKV